MQHGTPLKVACWLALALGLALPGRAQEPPGGQAPTERPRVLAAPDIGFRVPLPDNWSVLDTQVRGAWELSNVPESQKSGDVVVTAARVVVSIENRLGHEDAVQRLREIAAERKSPSTFVVIGGWPALQRRHLGPIAWRGATRPQGGPPNAWRLTTAIAMGSKIVRFEGFLPLQARPELLDEVEALARAIEVESVGDPAAATAAVKRLQTEAPAPPPAVPMTALPPQEVVSEALPLAEAGLNVRINNGAGVDSEIEVAVSADGRNIVLGNNGRDFMFSNDGGRTFTQRAINPGFPANGDPSLAWGPSGNFYYAFIGYPDNSAAAGNVQGCATTMTRSTDNGQTFNFVNHAALCPFTNPGMCFPDQEHIAADRWNAAPGGDQVYSVWRNFTPAGAPPANCGGIGGGFVQVRMTCSADSGQNWTVINAGNGDFPRVTAGRDGFVYVVTWNGNNLEVNKFSSCAAGLAQQAGYPRVITSIGGFDCNLPGHDRCDQNPASQTISVDELNPNRVFVAYADTTAAGVNENVFVRASLDGGATWDAGRVAVVNAPVSGRRIMPWMCTVGGTAHVTWFDRRNATPMQNDATEFWGGSVSLDGGGTLTAGPDYKISTVADNWCDSGWPCGTRSVASAETCSVQPQLAGTCSVSGARCDFSTGCGAGGVCQTGNGCPAYGDYNGAACAAGRVYAAWASGTSPAAITPASTDIDAFFSAKVVCCVPQIQVPGPVTFGNTCTGSSASATLNVCNTGKENLEVDDIESSNPRFTVTEPSSGYPVVISPDFCFPFQATFSPTTAGAQAATFTITSNDPVNRSVEVQATGTGGQATIDTFIADSGDFGQVCVGDFKDLPLTIQNSGTCPLTVNTITTTAPFLVPGVTSLPITVAPGVPVEVPVRFQPTVQGDFDRTVTITSSDPASPSRSVAVSGLSSPPDVNLTGSGDFGAVCAGVAADHVVNVCNTGACPLSVTGAAVSCADFTILGNPFPASVAAGECIPVTIRYTPQSLGTHTCNFVVTTSNDPDEPVVNLPLAGTTPSPVLTVGPDLAFPPTVIQSVGACQSALPFLVTNTGTCPATVNAISIGGPDAVNYSFLGAPGTPITLDPGEQVGEGDLMSVFRPDVVDRDRIGSLSVNWLADPIANTSTTITRNTCGEGVLTGARVLVRIGGVPAPKVAKIQIQRLTANRNRKIVDTVDSALNLPLQTWTPEPGTSCQAFSFHREYGTVGNPVMLAPGSYVVTATALVSGKRQKKTVAFDLNTCGFNPTVIVDF